MAEASALFSKHEIYEPVKPPMKKPALLASCWTTAGNAYPIPNRNLSTIPLRERIEKAAKAGFLGFGFLDADIHKHLESSNLSTLVQILDDNGIVYRELEFLTNWWIEDGEEGSTFKDRQFFMDTAEKLNARIIKIAPNIYGGPLDIDAWAAQLHVLAQEAQDFGTSVALEFMAFSNIPTLNQAITLTKVADHPNCGVILDAWHLDRSHTPLVELAKVPLSLIKGVELDDGSSVEIGDPYDDTIHRRTLCGLGDFQLHELVKTLHIIGWDGPWGVELISEEFRHLSLDDLLPKVYESTMSAFLS